jgi:glycosyltransferase involved in cell wall biosynthesis
MSAHVLHILGTAQPAAASIAGMVRTLRARLDPAEYQLSACFIGCPGPWSAELAAAGVTTFEVSWPAPLNLAGAWRFWRFLRSRPVDLLHLHYGGRSVRALARRATAAPLVMHLHGYVNNEADHRPVRLRLGDVDSVIATSQAVAAVVESANVTVVYPGVEVRMQGGPRDAWTVGAAGRLVHIKGYDCLLQAFSALHARCPEARLEIAGDGPERVVLEQQACTLGIATAVRFLGWRDDLDSLMSRWSVFVQPSREEALGIAVLQAMAAAVPVVVSDVGGLPEIVEPGRTGVLVPPGNTAALASALVGLLRDSEMRQRLGRAGRQQALEFSEERFATGVARIYADQLARRGDPATAS